ncbi:tripartite tricarboxylate transporter TctB family protein [Psychromonas sp. psych-6C06]|uniref:tripartite tricarboxylate transporter TctB family protein n=1 Tax=Psychromonas sp. psych-6C06 TaxID=2058089 RepID=UPI000C33441A|nr:tripartite tricarboxylate transporter TctB family protein [Psychromonas sp. psych-6C06]PKF63303.1 tripartite tricarboxylate transporter TctB family protein [Psychromonas sp. psych-6C06]
MFNRNIIFPALMIIVSMITLVLITQFAVPRYQDASVGAGFFPAIIAIIQVFICCVLIFQYLQKKAHQKETPLISRESIFGVLFLIGYALLISLIGYLYASLIGFTLYLVYYKIKQPLYYVIAWVFVLSIYYLFGEVFVISLPEGLLFY